MNSNSLEEIDLGSIKSKYFVDREGNVFWQYQSRLKEVSQHPNNTGYLTVFIAGKRLLVHRLIAKAYIPNPDNKRCVNHIDGNKLNNHVSNLEWATHSENMRHAFDTGLYPPRKGSAQNNAKLTDDIVMNIKRRLLAGETGTSLAKEYGVSHGRIYDIKHGRGWNHVAAGLDKQ